MFCTDSDTQLTEYEFVRYMLTAPASECLGRIWTFEMPGQLLGEGSLLVDVRACTRHWMDLSSALALEWQAQGHGDNAQMCGEYWAKACSSQGWDEKELGNMLMWMAPR